MGLRYHVISSAWCARVDSAIREEERTSTSELVIGASSELDRERGRGMPGSVGPLDVAGVQIPWHFRCPISLELMRDPVTVSTGQTYDRASIESWVATGNTTCPVTRARLTDFTLIPNHTLRRLIQEWCVAHRSLGVERIPTPKQPADPALVRHLVSQAAASSDTDARLSALRRLRTLARESEKNRAVISTPETRSALVSIAFEGAGDADDLSVEALGLLAAVQLTDVESEAVTARPEWLARLGAVLRGHKSVEARISAAVVVEAVSAVARAAVGAAEGVVEGLVELVEERDNNRAVRAGVRGLFALCLGKENRWRAVAAGAPAAVVARLRDLAGGEAERALATVELLCRAEGGREAVVAEGPRVVRALVGAMAGKASERAAEHAAGALVAVLSGSEELQREAVAAGVVTQLLLMVQSGCSDRARRKAQLLLKLLRAAWPLYCHDSIAANSQDFLQAF